MTGLTDDDISNLLTDHAGGGYTVPKILRKALMRFAGEPSKVVASACSFVNDNTTTQWKVLWLTNELIICATATRSQTAVWHGNEDGAPKTAEVWARRIRDVRVLATQPEALDNAGGELGDWREQYDIVFGDGASVQIPLFVNHAARSAADAPALAFLDKLRESL